MRFHVPAVALVILLLNGCMPGEGSWEAGPIQKLGPDEKTLMKDAFSIENGARDLRLFLQGGKDFSLFAQWQSDASLIDLSSTTDPYEQTNQSNLPNHLISSDPAWWNPSQTYDAVLKAEQGCVYIGVLQLDDGTYRYDAVRISGGIKMSASVYQYFE